MRPGKSTGVCRRFLPALVLLSSLASGDATSWEDPCTAAGEGATAYDPEHTLWNELLRDHVRQGSLNGINSTLVVYEGVERDVSKLRAYMRTLCSVDLAALSAAEALAFLCNAYNAVMVAMVLAYDVRDSVRAIPNVWYTVFATVAGQPRSLDDIEHGLVRGRSGVPFAVNFGAAGRAHACLNCGSLSCPDLLQEAFVASRLEEQLTGATQAWLANPGKNPGVDESSNRVRVSKIFDWFGGDFVAAAGSKHEFFRRYSDWPVEDSMAIEYVEYNWALNSWNGTGDWTGAAYRSRVAAAAAMVLLPLSLRNL